ncbi:hypothetical protein FB451DRAFT_1416105 [Mycena latifolia]|nr:hypothetical protein FB451DRAFT_1416105 [Mycena latifolia]
MHLLPPPLLALTFVLGTSSSASATAIGTPTNSATLPSLSGVFSCVANCLGLAAAANCSSEVAVNCFCIAPLAALTLLCLHRKTHPASLVSCLTACPDQVSSAEALVEQFCVAASKPTSLSFPSFIPSSISACASASSSAASNSSVGSSTAMALASSSVPPPPPPSNAAGAPRLGGMVVGLRGGWRLARHLAQASRTDAISVPIPISYAVSTPHTTSILLHPPRTDAVSHLHPIRRLRLALLPLSAHRLAFTPDPAPSSHSLHDTSYARTHTRTPSPRRLSLRPPALLFVVMDTSLVEDTPTCCRYAYGYFYPRAPLGIPLV